jgi:hypothetical protein
MIEEPPEPCNQKKQKLGETTSIGVLTFDPSGGIRLILENPSGNRNWPFIGHIPIRIMLIDPRKLILLISKLLKVNNVIEEKLQNCYLKHLFLFLTR